MSTRRRIVVLFLLALLGLASAAVYRLTHPGEETRGETVVLLHGMGRGRASMQLLALGLQERGYRVLNFPYDERKRTVAEIGQDLREYIASEVGSEPYHLVGHSLGNIVIRAGFAGSYPTDLRHIVMLAPPNHPALLASKLADNPIYKWRTGDAGQRLSDEEFYRSLPTPTVPFGIIAGTAGQTLTFKAPNDGIVLVESTKLKGMADWITVPHTHTFIMNGSDTLELIVRFLQQGHFK